jgi:hypothetical protein
MVPGVTTLALEDMLARHPDADSVELGFTAAATQSGGRGGVGFLFGQLARERRRMVRKIPFPAPIGAQRCLAFGRGEEGWFSGLPERIDCASWIYVAPPAAMAGLHVLNAGRVLRLLSPRLVGAGRRRLPRAPSGEPKREWVAVLRDGRRLEACSIDGRGDYAMTVASTLAFAEALLERRAAQPGLCGVHGPEGLFRLADLMPGFERRGIRVVRRDPETGAAAEATYEGRRS